jgi:hypothetical protein
MTAEDDFSLLEKHLLDADESPVAPEEPLPEVEPSTLPAFSVKKVEERPSEEIHFLVDEIRAKLDEDMERLMFQLRNPLAGKNVYVLKTFVKSVIHARAEQLHPYDVPEDMQPSAPVEEVPVHVASVMERSVEYIPVAEQVIPPAPQTLPSVGPTFPEIPKEQEYTLSALDAETHTPDQSNETRIRVIHIPLMMDEDTREIVARADYDEDEGTYRVYEPELDDGLRALLQQLKKDITDLNILKDMRSLQKRIAKSAKVVNALYDDQDYFTLKYYLTRDLALLGPVTPLLNDQNISAIVCEGQGIPLTIIREGKKVKTNVLFTGKDELNQFVLHVSRKTFQSVSLDDPVLDVVYKNFRIQGTLGTDIVPSRFIMTRVAL